MDKKWVRITLRASFSQLGTKEMKLGKLKIAVGLFLSLVISSFGMLQNVEEIMAKYYETMGGLENLRAWKSMRATARYIQVAQGGTEIPITVWYKVPEKTRIEMSQNSHEAVYVVTSESAWMCDASRGLPEPTLLPEEQARIARDNADVYPFIDYQKKGNKIEYLGTEEFEGANVYKIRLIQKTGTESLHFLDVQTGRELKITITVRLEGKSVTHETIERDFRRVGWLLLPFTTETLIGGVLVRKMVIESVELDPEIDDSLFQFPTRTDKKYQ